MNIHHMVKTPLFRLALLGTALLLAVVFPLQAYARSIKEIQAEINQKQKQANAAASESGHLHKKATTVEGQIEELQEQIASIQVRIDTNVARQKELSKKIKQAEARLEEQKTLLSANIRSMYIEGDISALEMLASSKNLGDFVDKQEYRDRIKDNITDTLDEIEKLKKQLDDQRKEVTAIIDEQKELQGELKSKQNDANRKLSSINVSKASFDKTVAKKAKAIAALRAEQAAINAAKNVGNVVHGSSSYPWSGSSMAYDDYCNYYTGGSAADPWGYCKRQCTSYVAWRLAKDGRSGFSNLGHAGGWVSGGKSISSSKVRRGDVAIFSGGPYGHVMYVEAVSGSTVYVSQFNWPGGGTYSTMSFNRNEAVYRRF